MRIVVIGGSGGRSGRILIPRLVEAGYEVMVVTREQRRAISRITRGTPSSVSAIDRAAEEARGEFGMRIRALSPDVVIDMISQAAAQRAATGRGAARACAAAAAPCGNLQVHGHGVDVPTTEAAPRQPFGEYGTQKAAIEAYLLREARQNGFPATVLHPGHRPDRAGRR